jgi:YrbI family 3-deoxy-D-manno-octulosonate 8-phosphate phosphatase
MNESLSFPQPNPAHPDLAAFRAHLQRGPRHERPQPIERWDTAARCAALVLDFDGVMTDNRVFQHQDGSELVACNRSDGMGIQMLMADGVAVIVLSKQRNPVVAARCATLGVPCWQNEPDKGRAIAAIAERLGVTIDRIAFMGNDVNDLPAMLRVGVSLAPADAERAVLETADYITARPGGRGAVRDACDHVLRARVAAGCGVAAGQ